MNLMTVINLNKLTLFVTILVSIFFAGCDSQQPRGRSIEANLNANKDITMRVSYTRESPSATPEVSVKLNGIPFNMKWDTGATTTVISSLELVNLIKAGKISENDLKGYINATVADGSNSSIPVYNIKQFVLTDTDGKEHAVYNVDVAVMDNMTATMLLGQNIMKEFPKYQFNDDEQEIEFYESR